MDVSHYNLATESFSFGWLPTQNDHHQEQEDQEDQEEASYVHNINNNNFNFAVSSSSSSLSPPSLVHADKLFSNGRIVPRSLINPPNNNYLRTEVSSYSYNNPTTSPGSVAIFASPSCYYHHRKNPGGAQLLGPKLKRVFHSFNPRRVLSKYMGCLVPHNDGSRGRSGIRVDDVSRRAWEVKSCSWSNCNTPQGGMSPLIRRVESDETSIYEAILYCKKSSGNSSQFPS